MYKTIVVRSGACLLGFLLLSQTASADPASQQISKSILPLDTELVQGLESERIAEASFIDQLDLPGSVVMSDTDQAGTRGESINGINELIQSRQLRYRILRNSADANSMFIHSTQ